MATWFANNIGTILITLALVLVVAAIVMKLLRDRRKGKSNCGSNCAHCAMAGSCHSKAK